jgi:hypothetical protein
MAQRIIVLNIQGKLSEHTENGQIKRAQDYFAGINCLSCSRFSRAKT